MTTYKITESTNAKDIWWTKVIDGKYQAIFRGLEDQPTVNGPCYRWLFQIINHHDYEGEVVSCLADKVFHGLTLKNDRMLSSLIGHYYNLGEIVTILEYQGVTYEIEMMAGNVFTFKQLLTESDQYTIRTRNRIIQKERMTAYKELTQQQQNLRGTT